MKIIGSFFSLSVFLDNIKRFWGISVTYFIILMSIFQIPIFQACLEANDSFNCYGIITTNTSFLIPLANAHSAILWFIPILTGVFMFSFIHESNVLELPRPAATDSSLSKTAVFLTQTVSGMLIMLIPVALNAVVLIIIQMSYQTNKYSVQQVLVMTGLFVLYELLIYFTTIFIGMLTRSETVHIVLTYVFYLAPIACYYIVTSLFANLFLGFTILNNELLNKIIIFTPLIKGFTLFQEEEDNISLDPYFSKSIYGTRELTVSISAFQVTVFICAAMFFIIAAFLVYRLRKPRTAGDISISTNPGRQRTSISTNPGRQIIKYIITFVPVLLTGLCIIGLGLKYFFIIIVIVAFIGYIAAQVYQRKSFRVWSSCKIFIAYSVIIAALYVVISDTYINRVPVATDIQSVLIGNPYNWQEIVEPSAKLSNIQFNGIIYEKPQNIESFIEMHRLLIAEEKNRVSRNIFKPVVYVMYNLKDGSQLIRAYYSTTTYDIMGVAEYSRDDQIFHQNVNNIVSIVFKGNRISARKQIFELVYLIKEDINDAANAVNEDNANNENSTNNGNSMNNENNLNNEKESTIEISVNNVYSKYPYSTKVKSDGKAAKWLKEHGYYSGNS